MPAGIIHYKFFKSGYILIIPEFIYLLFLNPIFSVSVLIGYSFHRYMDNDWDIMSTSDSEGRMVNELKIIGYLLYGVSSVYVLIFRRKHRSFETHFPLFSTIIRIIFLFWWIPLLFYFNKWSVQIWEWVAFFGFWWGLSQADAIHWLADMFWSEDSKKWVEQDKEKQWRKKYSRHINKRTKVSHIKHEEAQDVQ